MVLQSSVYDYWPNFNNGLSKNKLAIELGECNGNEKMVSM